MSEPNSKHEELQFDIRRTLILGLYMQAWGMPEFRTISTNRYTNGRVEVYSFPTCPKEKVHRIATVGASNQVTPEGQRTDWELCFVLPTGLGGATLEAATAYMLDIMAHCVNTCSKLNVGQTIVGDKLAPSSWAPRCLLFDEPRGEPEFLESFNIGQQMVRLVWAIPVFTDEVDLIRMRGLQAFDSVCERSDLSLADVNRGSFISTN